MSFNISQIKSRIESLDPSQMTLSIFVAMTLAACSTPPVDKVVSPDPVIPITDPVKPPTLENPSELSPDLIQLIITNPYLSRVLLAGKVDAVSVNTKLREWESQFGITDFAKLNNDMDTDPDGLRSSAKEMEQNAKLFEDYLHSPDGIFIKNNIPTYSQTTPNGYIRVVGGTAGMVDVLKPVLSEGKYNTAENRYKNYSEYLTVLDEFMKLDSIAKLNLVHQKKPNTLNIISIPAMDDKDVSRVMANINVSILSLKGNVNIPSDYTPEGMTQPVWSLSPDQQMLASTQLIKDYVVMLLKLGAINQSSPFMHKHKCIPPGYIIYFCLIIEIVR